MKKCKMVSVGVAVLSLVLGLAGPMAAFAAGPAAINLGPAGNFVILAKTGISTTGDTTVVGDIGISPAAATYITGFALNLSAGSGFATSNLVLGEIYAPGYANPTPATMTAAISAMETAYTDGAGRTNPTATELGAGNIGGMTLAPGLYKWSSGVTIPADVTLNGAANDVWIFQIAQNLTMSSATKVILSGGAQYSNIFWVVAGQATIGTTAVFNGTILDQTAIVLNTGATLNGRALAQTAVTLDSNIVNTMPIYGATTPATPAVPAIPATPPGGTNTSVTPATPAVPATPATPANPTATPTRPTTKAGVTATTPTASAFGQQVRTIAVNLRAGSRSNNITVLQQFLISQNKGPAAQALAKVGATAYFGSLTRQALAEFQAKVGIRPALGIFGPITRAYLSAHSFL